eukprot:403375111
MMQSIFIIIISILGLTLTKNYTQDILIPKYENIDSLQNINQTNILEVIQCHVNYDDNQFISNKFMITRDSRLLVIPSENNLNNRDLSKNQGKQYIKSTLNSAQNAKDQQVISFRLPAKIHKISQNYDGSAVIIELQNDQVLAIKDCQLPDFNENEGVYHINDNKFLEYKFPKKQFDYQIKTHQLTSPVVLAHRFQDNACLQDPTISDCKYNLFYTNALQNFDWWLLAKNILKYEFTKINHVGSQIGVLVLNQQGLQKSKVLYYFDKIDIGTPKSIRISNQVEDFYVVNQNYLYIIKNMQKSLNEYIMKYNLNNLKGQPQYIKLNNHLAFSQNLKIKFIENIPGDPRLAYMAISDQILDSQTSKKNYLYQSDARGVQFSLVMSDVNTIEKPNAQNLQSISNLVPDFYKVQSMDFVLIVNVKNDERNSFNKDILIVVSDQDDEQIISNQASGQKLTTDNNQPLKVQAFHTLISLNNGAQWHKIQKVYDLQGNRLTCENAKNSQNLDYDEECHLNLILYNYREFNVQSIKSYEKAQGFIIANGYMGSNSQYIQTFASNDGGLSWKQISEDGPSHFIFLEAAQLLVLYQIGQETDKITITSDYSNFTQILISNTPIFIKKITQDLSNPYAIIVETYDVNFQDKLVFLNLLDFLQSTNSLAICDKQLDFELFQPHDLHALHTQCYMGAKYSYFRKKPQSNCYLSPDESSLELQAMINKRLKTPCECTDLDYECDEGFQRAGGEEDDTNICVPIKINEEDIHKAEKECALHDYFYKRSGYRKIPENLCQGGVHKERDIRMPCVDSLKDYTLRYLLLMLMISLVMYVIYLTYWFYRNQWRDQKMRQTIKKAEKKRSSPQNKKKNDYKNSGQKYEEGDDIQMTEVEQEDDSNPLMP